MRLDLTPADLNGLAERSTRESPLGSFCTVFAATEILEKIRAGLMVEDIIKGAFRSVVNRVREMDVVTGTLVMTGGVAAYNPALVGMVEETFGRPVAIAARPAVHRRLRCGAVRRGNERKRRPAMLIQASRRVGRVKRVPPLLEAEVRWDSFHSAHPTARRCSQPK